MKTNRKPIIGVMGPGHSDDPKLLNHAKELGRCISEKGWLLLTGGRNTGVMDAASNGAHLAGGIVIGILPGDSHKETSRHVTVPILTGMGSARNVINILTADLVVVCGMGAGTASEAALALKHNKPVIFTHVTQNDLDFFSTLNKGPLHSENNLEKLIEIIEKLVHQ
jgi:uncharacterized protein (TIGR00725 family)